MKDYKKISIAFVLSQFISLNNVLQMYFLSGKELINKLAIWESSSTLVLIVYYLYLFFGVLARKRIIKFLSPKEGMVFFGDLLIKIISIVVTIMYITVQYKTEYGYVFYLLQIILFGIDVAMGVYIIKSIKHINNSKLEELKSYEFEVEPIVCNKDDYDQVLVCVTIACLISIINLDYFFIAGISVASVVAMVIFFINISIFYFSRVYFDKRLTYFKNISLKLYKRNMVYLNMANVINFTLCILMEEVRHRLLFVFIWTFATFIYSLLRVVVPVVKTSSGMEKYLKSNQK